MSGLWFGSFRGGLRSLGGPPPGRTRVAARTAGHLAHHASLKTCIRLPNLAARIRKWRGQAGLDPYGRCGRGRTGYSLCLRNDFNRVNCRVFDLGRENNAKLSVGHFHRHSFDIGAFGTAGLRPNVKVLEFMPLDIEGKDALARGRNSLRRSPQSRASRDTCHWESCRRKLSSPNARS